VVIEAQTKSIPMRINRFSTALVIVGIAVTASAQKKPATPAQEWTTYNHDLGGTRFSPLTVASVAPRKPCRLSSPA
jgi:glucose dehydrogenase